MSKFCAWDGHEIVGEVGSIERRVFRRDGKDCYYFCNDACEVMFITNDNEPTIMPKTISEEP